MDDVKQDVSIELTGERVVSFMDRGKAITYKLRQISREAWFKFYDAIAFRTERGAGSADLDAADAKDARVDKFDGATPLAQLAFENVISVEGYVLPGGKSLMELANWKDRLPAGHRAHVGQMLADVRIDQVTEDEAGFLIDPEFEIVRLQAFWGSDEPGKMLNHTGLVHRFKPVSIEHQRRVNRAKSQSIVVGGSRRDLTIFPNASRVFAEIYDELIFDVTGYTIGGKPVATVDEVKQHMDTQHKVAAAMLLFRAPEDGI